MSHARIDINETILKGKWYNFAFESMDMFYQRELLQRLIQKEEFTKNIIIEMPYYYFNYDISKTIETFKIRTRAFFELDEYHHYLESQEGKIWIDAYKKMLNIAGEISYLKASNASKIEYIKKFIRFYRRKNFKKVWNESEKVAISQKLDHVWSIYRNDTIKENIGIWKNIQKIIKKLNINLTILICPINPLFLEKNYIEISKMKDLFYNSIGNGSFRILDYSDKFDSEVYFSDYCHLNVGGNALFTKTLKLVL